MPDEAPLSDDQVRQITEFLMKTDGVAQGAMLGGKFKVKKAQLKRAGFDVGEKDQNGQSVVAIRGWLPLGVKSSSSPPRKEKVRNAKEATEPRNFFDDVWNYLVSAGGSSTLASVVSTFQMKKAALEKFLEKSGFIISSPNAHGNQMVALPGIAVPEPQEVVCLPSPVRPGKGHVLPWMVADVSPGMTGEWQWTTCMEDGSWQTWMPPGNTGLLASGGLAEADIQSGQLRGIDVATFLEAVGGHASMAFVGPRFKVEKEELLNAGFVMGPPNESGHSQVALPGSQPPPPPGWPGAPALLGVDELR